MGAINPVMVNASCEVPVIPVTLIVLPTFVQLPVKPTKVLQLKEPIVKLGASATNT